MKTFELAKKFITNQQYRILEADNTDGHIVFRFQVNPDDEKFFFMTLPSFADVTEENIAQVKENCHQINEEVKLVKLYVLDDVILAAAEVYYMAAKDFEFQMKNALKHLVAAKVMYKKLDE